LLRRHGYGQYEKLMRELIAEYGKLDRDIKFSKIVKFTVKFLTYM